MCFVFLLDFVLRPCGVFYVAEGYPPVLFYMQGVFLSVCFVLDFVLRPCGVFHITEGYPLFLFYIRGGFLTLCISVGLCPQVVWCTPRYRGLSACFYLVWAVDKEAFSVDFIVDRFSLPNFLLCFYLFVFVQFRF